MKRLNALSITTALIVSCIAAAPITAQEATEEAQVITPGAFADSVIIKLSDWNLSASRAALDEKKEAFGDTAAYKTALGLLEAQDGKFDKALKTLEAASKADAADPAAEFYRGLALYWKKDMNGAKDAWQKASTRAKNVIARQEKDARAHFYQGASQVYLKQYGLARASLDKALANGFDEAMAHYYIGLSFAFEQNWQKAKESLDHVLGKDERFAYAYFYRGMVWEKLGRKDNMLVDMDRFVKLAPDAPDAGKAKALLAAAGG
jgi:tetratricopeptide (TPR) repeat protein